VLARSSPRLLRVASASLPQADREATGPGLMNSRTHSAQAVHLERRPGLLKIGELLDPAATESDREQSKKFATHAMQVLSAWPPGRE
jgi:hypothetical protein